MLRVLQMHFCVTLTASLRSWYYHLPFLDDETVASWTVSCTKRWYMKQGDMYLAQSHSAGLQCCTYTLQIFIHPNPVYLTHLIWHSVLILVICKFMCSSGICRRVGRFKASEGWWAPTGLRLAAGGQNLDCTCSVLLLLLCSGGGREGGKHCLHWAEHECLKA